MGPGGAKRYFAKGFLKLSYGGTGKSYKQEELLSSAKKTTEGFDHWTTLPGITYYFSLLWCKKIYALHKVPSY